MRTFRLLNFQNVEEVLRLMFLLQFERQPLPVVPLGFSRRRDTRRVQARGPHAHLNIFIVWLLHVEAVAAGVARRRPDPELGYSRR